MNIKQIVKEEIKKLLMEDVAELRAQLLSDNPDPIIILQSALEGEYYIVDYIMQHFDDLNLSEHLKDDLLFFIENINSLQILMNSGWELKDVKRNPRGIVLSLFKPSGNYFYTLAIYTSRITYSKYYKNRGSWEVVTRREDVITSSDVFNKSLSHWNWMSGS